MLVIRMQRTGRKGHAQFRIIVQDARLTPTSGKVVAQIGSYDPHAKTVIVDKEKAKFYLEHGAQPSGRVARLLKEEGVKLPDWVKLTTKKDRSTRNVEKRRSTRPAEPKAPEAPAAEVVEANPEAVETEAPVEATETPEVEVTSDEAPAEAATEATPEEEAPAAEAETEADAPAEEVTEPETPAEKEA